MKSKHSLILLTSLALVTCGTPTRVKRGHSIGAEKKSDDAKPTVEAKDPSEVSQPQASTVEKLALKVERKEFVLRNFDQIYFTLASLTEVDPKNPEVLNSFVALKNQLPSGNQVSLMSPFSELAMMNLAGSFCELSITGDSKLADLSISPEAFVDAMLAKFLDSAPATYTGIADVRSSLLGIVKSSNNLVPINDKLMLRRVACAAFLSSGFIFLY